MRFSKLNNLFMPAFLIVAVIGILLVFITISTKNNLDRDKTNFVRASRIRAEAILFSLENFMRTEGDDEIEFFEKLPEFITEIKIRFNVSHLFMVDMAGTIVAGEKPHLGSVDSKQEGYESFVRNVRILPGGIFEIVAPLSEPPKAIATKALITDKDGNRYPVHIVMGLHMDKFEAVVKSDLHHSYIMGGILLILGAGVIFFLYVIQNYYQVGLTLRETQNYTNIVVENMANGLISIDNSGYITTINSQAAEFLEIDENNYSGKNLSKYIDFSRSGIFETLADKKSVLDREVEFKKVSGKLIPLSLSVSPISGMGGYQAGAVIVIRDLTGIKELEAKLRLSEKLAAVGEFAAGVAHEIRNPLSSVRGFAKFLAHSLREKPKEGEYAEVIVKEVDRINNVVSDLLNFSRPVEPEIAPVDILKILKHIKTLVKNDLENKSTELLFEIHENAKIVYADENLLTQVFLNLILNSLAAISGDGLIQISSFTDSISQKITICVEDNGSGISPDDIKKVFDPFFTTSDEGTGLGLPITHSIIEAHGGEIEVVSPPPGKTSGSLFRFSFPVSEVS